MMTTPEEMRREAAPYLERADGAFRAGGIDAAIAALDEAIRERPSCTALHQRRVAYMRGNTLARDIAIWLRGQLASLPDDYFLLLELGNTLRGDSHVPEALELHARLLQRFPDDLDASVALAQDEIILGAAVKALPRVESAVRANPHRMDYLNVLGRALAALGRHREAIAAYEEIVRRMPQFALAWIGLADANGRLHREDEQQRAMEACGKILAAPSAMLEVLRAEFAMKRNQPEAAVRHFASALELHPRSYRALVGLGFCLVNAGRLDDAEQYLATAVGIAPWDGDAAGSWAQFLVMTGRGEPDFATLEQAAREVPHNRLAGRLGQIYFMHKGDLPRAVAMLELAVMHLPEDVDSLNLLGEAHMASGNLESAARAFRTITELSPREGMAWYGLAFAEGRRREWPIAMRAFREAVKLLPSNPAVRHAFGAALASVGEMEQAAGEMAQAVRLAPTDGAIRASFAAALQRLGRMDEARAEAVRARELLGPDHPTSAALSEIAGQGAAKA